VKDLLSHVNPILLSTSEDTFTTYEKLRVIILYVLGKNGVNRESLEKIFQHAGIDSNLISAITNLEFLGFPPYQVSCIVKLVCIHNYKTLKSLTNIISRSFYRYKWRILLHY